MQFILFYIFFNFIKIGTSFCKTLIECYISSAKSSAIWIFLIKLISKTFDRAHDSAEHILRTETCITLFPRAYLYTNGGFYGWLSVCPKFLEKERVKVRDDMKVRKTPTERDRFRETD